MKFLDNFCREVPFKDIRHNDAESYMKEGFGASPVEKWPVYIFFTKYFSGNKEGSRMDFEGWYQDQLNKYAMVPKSLGGMQKGSLYELIERKCGANFCNIDNTCKLEAIKERVEGRFSLFDEIQRNGYKLEKAERVEAIRKGALIYLCGGHHRAAILKVLGYESLPKVLVFPNQFIYNVFRLIRNLRHGQI